MILRDGANTYPEIFNNTNSTAQINLQRHKAAEIDGIEVYNGRQ